MSQNNNFKRKIMVWWYKKSEEFLAAKHKFRGMRPVRKYRRLLNNYVISHYRSNYVEIEGRKMFLDPNDSLRLSLMDFGQFIQDFVKTQVKLGDTVLDLGANIGFWTLFFAQKVGSSGKVYGFEPEPFNFQLLEKNVKINEYENVILVQKAVSNKTEKIKLYLSAETTDHRIYDPHDNRKSIEIESVRLDDYFKNSDIKIDFIKSNIQGADASAFEGMKNLLESSNNLKAIIEFYPSLLVGFGSDPRQFLNLLVNCGFILYDLNWKEKKLDKMDVSQLLKKYTPEIGNGTYLFIRKRDSPLE